MVNPLRAENKHTPGPWEIEDDMVSDAFQIWAKEGGHICEIEAPPETKEKYRPNALLICAAPELLEACRFAAQALAGVDLIENAALPKLIEAIHAATGSTDADDYDDYMSGHTIPGYPTGQEEAPE